jgi:hypothetical protein
MTTICVTQTFINKIIIPENYVTLWSRNKTKFVDDVSWQIVKLWKQFRKQ